MNSFASNAPQELDDNVDALLQGLITNRAQLQPVINEAATVIGTGISQNDSQLNKLSGQLKTPLTRAINQNNQQLQPLVNTLNQQLQTNTAENTAQLAMLQQQTTQPLVLNQPSTPQPQTQLFFEQPYRTADMGTLVIHNDGTATYTDSSGNAIQLTYDAASQIQLAHNQPNPLLTQRPIVSTNQVTVLPQTGTPQPLLNQPPPQYQPTNTQQPLPYQPPPIYQPPNTQQPLIYQPPITLPQQQSAGLPQTQPLTYQQPITQPQQTTAGTPQLTRSIVTTTGTARTATPPSDMVSIPPSINGPTQPVYDGSLNGQWVCWDAQTNYLIVVNSLHLPYPGYNPPNSVNEGFIFNAYQIGQDATWDNIFWLMVAQGFKKTYPSLQQMREQIGCPSPVAPPLSPPPPAAQQPPIVSPPPLLPKPPAAITPPPPAVKPPQPVAVVQQPSGNVIVNVAPCCPEPQLICPDTSKPAVAVKPATEERPDETTNGTTKPKVNVAPAGEERPDEIQQANKDPFAPLGGQIPRPGSADWCNQEANIVNAFIVAGKFFLGRWQTGLFPFIDQLDNTVTKQANELANKGGLANSVISILLSLTSFVGGACVAAIGAALNTLTPLIAPYQYRGGQELMGLYVIRAMIHALQKIRVGSDAGVWITADFSIDLDVWLESVDYIIKIYTTNEVPSVAEAMESWLHNTINADTYGCWMRLNGSHPDTFAPVLVAKREQPTVEQWIEFGRRHDWNDAQINNALRGRGIISPDERFVQNDLYDELPTIADHLHWLQRNVFDDAYVTDYDLLDGFEDRFWTKFGHDLRAQGMKKEYAALHYAAHWILPATGQLFEMLRRLRPGRVDKSIVFTENDLLRLLAEQDVAPYFRQRLRAIAYAPFGLRFLRQLWDTRQIDKDELVQRFMDISYNEKDATTLANSEDIRRNRTIATQTRGYTIPNLKTLYLAKTIDANKVRAEMQLQGYPNEVANTAMDVWDKLETLADESRNKKLLYRQLEKTVRDAYDVGTMSVDDVQSVYFQAGMSQSYARDLANAIATEYRTKDARAAVRSLRKGYLGGRFAEAHVISVLQYIGIKPDKIKLYIDMWNVELAGGARMLSAENIKKMACQGIISIDVARARLLNLNFSDVDAELLTAQAQRCLDDIEAKSIAAEQKIKSQQAKAVQQAIDANKRQLDRLQAQLHRLGTPANIVKWYKDGAIGRKYATARLLALGVLGSDIEAALNDADLTRPKKASTAKSTTTTGS